MELGKPEITKLRKSFFPPLILLECLNNVCPQGPIQKASDSPPNPNQFPREMFHTLVNKLAQILDTHPKGDTVTAMTVIQQNGRICYVFASNKRTTGTMRTGRAGLAAVLNILKSNLEAETRESDQMMEEKLMRQILDMNNVRVKSYLTRLSRDLEACSKKCAEDPEGTS